MNLRRELEALKKRRQDDSCGYCGYGLPITPDTEVQIITASLPPKPGAPPMKHPDEINDAPCPKCGRPPQVYTIEMKGLKHRYR